ncbi:MAG: ABC transporter ATP-binding protein [Candidatus Methanosuratus sp.]|nr:ABC transporter ATP-binding protein [Candidatus Methanosuratincola sp.]
MAITPLSSPFFNDKEQDNGKDAEYAVFLKGITKIFPNGTVANHDVTLGILKGEVHAILGENGAGKTTLMRIISGILKPDSGEILIDGKPVRIRDPMEASRLGIGMVHQHFTLIPEFTVRENIALVLATSGWLNLKKVDEKITSVSKSMGLEIDPDSKIESLPIGKRQQVEILRLLCQDVKILILDEPTSVLTPIEVDSFFRMIRDLKSSGKTIVLITHKMKEALQISDRITVLRAGRVIKTIPTSEANEALLASLVVEGMIPATVVRRGTPGAPVLRVESLRVSDDRGRPAVDGLSLVVRSGEIVGIAGVAGNGQKELVEAITGLRRVESGTVRLALHDITNKPTRFIIERGISYIPEDRLHRGVILTMGVHENLALKCIGKPPMSRKSVIDRGLVLRNAENLISRFSIKVPDPCTSVENLSGGNIQKLIVARELSNGGEVLIAEQPTAGLDIKASEAVHQELVALRSKGIGILLVSSDLDEIIKLSDRICVIFGGRIVGEFVPENLDIERLSRLMLGAE